MILVFVLSLYITELAVERRSISIFPIEIIYNTLCSKEEVLLQSLGIVLMGAKYCFFDLWYACQKRSFEIIPLQISSIP